MKIGEAISQKLLNICKEEDMNVNKLAMVCCLTQSTVENIVNNKSKNPKILTLVRICDGLDMSLSDFFDDELFDNIDRED